MVEVLQELVQVNIKQVVMVVQDYLHQSQVQQSQEQVVVVVVLMDIIVLMVTQVQVVAVGQDKTLQ